MNNKSCGCNKCMPKPTKCMAAKPECNVCKNNTWSDCNDNFDCNKFNNMVKKSNEITGYKNDNKKSCTCQNDCKKSYTCTCQENANKANTAKNYSCGCQNNVCQNNYKKSYSCECRECPLKGHYQEVSNNECAPEFACEVDSLPLGMAYVPYQEWNCNVSNACQGLCDGTIFPELVKPFGCTPCNQERRSW